jgi:CRISPR system Cascade subunit CasA
MLDIMTFNLIDERWIPVVSQDWQRFEVSLLELFTTWENLREIQADNPPTTLAIYRFLLAILHRAYQGPKNVDHWEEIQQDNGKGAVAYLNQWRDRFDLVHPKYPFMQDVSIGWETAEKCYPYLAYELHGENTSTVFCHQHHWSNSYLSMSEATRLVMRLHMFDFHGRKMGATDRAGAIPMMGVANCLFGGKSLQQTVFMNLMIYDPAKEKPSVVNGEDCPGWERDTESRGYRIPNGYIDYLSYQWRRVKVFADNNKVVRVVSHPGDQLQKSISERQWECSIAYKKMDNGMFPVKLDLKRSLWRDSAVFLQSADNSYCPRIMEWIAELQVDELIPKILNLNIFGLSVENAKPWSSVCEKLSIPSEYLTNRAPWQSLKVVIAIAEDHQHTFRSFQGSPYYALAKELNPQSTSNKTIGEQARQLATTLDGESRYWARLDRAFQELLKALPLDKTVDGNGVTYGTTQLPAWTKTVQKAAKDAFTESIASIRNYEARAKALRALEWKLADLRASPEEKAAKKTKAAAKKKEKVSK